MLQPRCGMFRGRACLTHVWQCHMRRRTQRCAPMLCSYRLITQKVNGSSDDINSTTTTTTTVEVNPGVQVTTTRHASGKKLSITIRSPPRPRPSQVTCPPEPSAESSAGLHPSPPTLPSSTTVNMNKATTSTQESTTTRGKGDSSSSNTSSTSSVVHRRVAVAQAARVPFAEPVKRIILIRNGMSEANSNPTTYVTTPDWRIPLLDEGKQECIAAGLRLANLVADEPVYFYYSPYIRSRQSLRYVLQGYDEGRRRASAAGTTAQWWDSSATRLTREQEQQQWANEGTTTTATSNSECVGEVVSAPLHLSRPDAYYTELVEAEESQTGGTNTNTHSGTAGADVTKVRSRGQPVNQLNDTALLLRPDTQRHIIGVREDVRLRDGDIGRYSSVAEFMHHLQERDRYGNFFYRFPHGESGADVCDRVTSFLDAFQRERLGLPMDSNVVLITHGLTIRMFITRWFHLTVDTFHTMRSPPTGFLATLTRLHHQSRFQLDDDCFAAMRLPPSLNEKNGYKYRNKELLGSMSTGAPYM